MEVATDLPVEDRAERGAVAEVEGEEAAGQGVEALHEAARS